MINKIDKRNIAKTSETNKTKLRKARASSH